MSEPMINMMDPFSSFLRKIFLKIIIKKKNKDFNLFNTIKFFLS